MVETDTGYLTQQGNKLFNQMNAGKNSIAYTRIVFSSDNLTNESEDQITQTIDLKNQEISLPAQSYSDDNNIVHIRVVGNNENIKNGFYVNTYGIYAKGNDGQEILYGISCDANPAYITSYDGISPQSLSYEWKLKVSRTDKINLDATNAVYATIDDLTNLNNVILKEISKINFDGIDHNFTGNVKYNGNDIATVNGTNEAIQSSLKDAKEYTDSKKIYYNINDYGAQANNQSFDNAPIINNIIQSLQASGGTIVVPEGDYYINSSININSNYVHLMGINSGFRSNIDAENTTGNLHPGGGSKLIINNTSSTAIQIGTSNGTPRISGVEIDHLRIIGINYDPTNCSTTAINVAQNNDGIAIHNNVITNVKNGIIMTGSDSPMIKDNYLCELANSVKLLESSQQAQITGNEMGAQPTGITLQLDGATNALIANNNIYPDGQNNIVLNNCIMCSINGNIIKSYYTGMINIVGGNNNSISNNQMYAQTKNGQWAEDPIGRDKLWGLIFISSDSTTLIGNHITSEQPGPDTRINIHTGTDCRLLSNMINGYVSTAAIVVAKVCQNTVIVYSANTSEINDIGTNTRIISIK